MHIVSEEGGARGGAVDFHDLFFGEREYIYERGLVGVMESVNGGSKESGRVARLWDRGRTVGN